MIDSQKGHNLQVLLGNIESLWVYSKCLTKNLYCNHRLWEIYLQTWLSSLSQASSRLAKTGLVILTVLKLSMGLRNQWLTLNQSDEITVTDACRQLSIPPNYTITSKSYSGHSLHVSHLQITLKINMSNLTEKECHRAIFRYIYDEV